MSGVNMRSLKAVSMEDNAMTDGPIPIWHYASIATLVLG